MLVGCVALFAAVCSDTGMSVPPQALRSNVAQAVRRVKAIRPDSSEDLEQIVAFEHPFNANNSRTRAGTRVAIAFPTMRKLTGFSF